MALIKTLQQVLQQFKEKHGDKYDYSLIKVYDGGKKKCKIICPKHGIFETTFDGHIQGAGCKKCQYEKLHKKYVMPKDEFIKRSKEIYGDKYDYSKVSYNNSHDKIDIVCPIHGIFKKKLYKHLQGQGCPKCKCYHLEQIVEKMLKKENIEYQWQYEINDLKCDFYLPNHHIYIECQGEQHFVPTKFSPSTTDEEATIKFEKQKNRDQKLYDYIKANNEIIIYFTNKKYFRNKINIKENICYQDKLLFETIISLKKFINSRLP